MTMIYRQLPIAVFNWYNIISTVCRIISITIVAGTFSTEKLIQYTLIASILNQTLSIF